MKFKHFANLALILLLCGFFATVQAQNHPFSWKTTSDSWYMPEAYTFKYEGDEFTAKGKSTPGHGPVFSNDCKEATDPDACTGNLIKEKLRDVELPNYTFPNGYSGVEYVTFEVQTNGNVNNYQVVKQSVLCKPCIQIAVNKVAELGEWHPAIQEGIFVKSTVVVPVYFKTGKAQRNH
jgi:hypothetical protein